MKYNFIIVNFEIAYLTLSKTIICLKFTKVLGDINAFPLGTLFSSMLGNCFPNPQAGEKMMAGEHLSSLSSHVTDRCRLSPHCAAVFPLTWGGERSRLVQGCGFLTGL